MARVHIDEQTDLAVYFTCEYHQFHIFIDEDREDGCYYCIGNGPDGGYVIDGWLPLEIDNFEDAIEWALKGAKLK